MCTPAWQYLLSVSNTIFMLTFSLSWTSRFFPGNLFELPKAHSSCYGQRTVAVRSQSVVPFEWTLKCSKSDARILVCKRISLSGWDYKWHRCFEPLLMCVRVWWLCHEPVLRFVFLLRVRCNFHKVEYKMVAALLRIDCSCKLGFPLICKACVGASKEYCSVRKKFFSSSAYILYPTPHFIYVFVVDGAHTENFFWDARF